MAVLVSHNTPDSYDELLNLIKVLYGLGQTFRGIQEDRTQLTPERMKSERSLGGMVNYALGVGKPSPWNT
jgi:hypothetical protein